MAHLHVTAWALAFILLFVVTYLFKQNDSKLGKILHMVLRLDYLVILFSGLSLFFSYSDKMNGELIVKVIAGLWAIVAMELITVRMNKDKPTKGFWIQLAIAALIAILLGFTRLPLGVLP